ncbi:hypothetical protein KP509_32G054500 [Ceratopteris richardii]|uniref:Two-component response regulator-like APRR2 n=2 Tax=Ceratopteris richardii TaxID=49495 RepID=A0A8T2QUW0_CERRI|nr:hypothetical protein KP509_32G054500 [Ceratopteris richardii]
MMALANQFPEWKDFPKGLRVMLVDQDLSDIEDVRCKLASCGYLVTCYSRGEDALQGLRDRSKIFDIVVVDATRNVTFDGFKIVEAAKQLTTIMIASTDNTNIMMQGIAAGASEFLQKPISEERLKNIWQHVVRKALLSGKLRAPTTMGQSVNSKATPAPRVLSEHKDGNGITAEAKPEYAINKQNVTKTDDASNGPTDHQLSSFQQDSQENCDAFLCSTPPQLEQSCTRIMTRDQDDNPDGTSPLPSAVPQDLDMKRELKDVNEYFEECEDYLQIKSQITEAVNNSVILNELFDSKSNMDSEDLLLADDDQSAANKEFGDTKLCAHLHFDDFPDSLDDIELAGSILDGTTDQSFSMDFECFEDDEFYEADEEALLLAEVAKAEEAGTQFIDTFCLARTANNTTSQDDDCINQSNRIDTSTLSSNVNVPTGIQQEMRCTSGSEHSCNTKVSKSSNAKKKMKVDWTPDLHRRFVQAVEQLGVDKAIPSRILELMGVKCLTRHNVASHLQKYRSHRKHVEAIGADTTNWNQRHHLEAKAATTGMSHGRIASSPCMQLQQQSSPGPGAAWPSSTHPTTIPFSATSSMQLLKPCKGLPVHTPALHVWGHPTLESLQIWPVWPPLQRVPFAPVPSIANIMPPTTEKPFIINQPKEMVVAAINEVLRNPYVPLPLGLKSPSLESVVSELQRQGVSMSATDIV